MISVYLLLDYKGQRNNEFRGERRKGRSTVAHFARKVRGAKIVAAQHGLKIQQSHVRYVFVALTLRAK